MAPTRVHQQRLILDRALRHMTTLLLNTAQLGFFGPLKEPPPPPPPPPPYILFEDYNHRRLAALHLCRFADHPGRFAKLFRFLFSKKSAFKPANAKFAGRVRHMFKKLDKDGSGGSAMEELLASLQRNST